MPDQSRPAAADGQLADRAPAQDPAGQRQPVARAGTGAFKSGGSGTAMTLGASSMVSLLPADRTLPRMLDIQAISHGDRMLLSAPGGSWTFRHARHMPARRAAPWPTAG